MKIILLTNKYSGAPLEIVKSEVPEDFEIRFLPEQTQDALVSQVSDVDYILAGGRLKITSAALCNAKNLKMIQRTGVGLDSIDITALKTLNIPLYVNKGINAQSVAEHSLLLILASLRKLNIIAGNTKKGLWSRHEQALRTYELKGKTVGIIGMGSIARTLAGLLKPFGTKLLYYDIKQLPQTAEQDFSLRFSDLDGIFSGCDIITIHCPLTDETRNLVRKETISKMKDGAVIVNTARGGIINAKDLAEALSCGKLSFAALDVHEKEPFPDDYPLKDVENVILTPHIAGITADSFRSMMREAFRNIEMFDKGMYGEIEKCRYI